MKHFALISCLLILILIGCNKANNKSDKEVHDFIEQWNEAHSPLKSPHLQRDYMDVVAYYGKERTRNQVQLHKDLLFQQFPDYSQHILNDKINVTRKEGNYLVSFTKQVKYNGIESDYITFLTLIPKNGVFKILREEVADNSKNLDAPIFPSTHEGNNSMSNSRQLFGDFNGDGLSDFANVISPEIITNMGLNNQDSDTVACKGGCNSVITFSSSDLKDITIEGVYQSQLENLKDLNNDGADEIGFWDIKPNTKSLYIFDATTGLLLTNPILINTTVHKNLKLIDVFKKSGPNKIRVTRSIEINGKWSLKSEVITLN